MSIAAVVADTEDVAASWCLQRGVPRYRQLREIPRLLPGQLLLFLREDPASQELLREMPFQGFSVIGREVADLICAPPSGAGESREKVAGALKGYLRLLHDFFPSSTKASTTVKLAACLTEATGIWRASGGAVLTGAPGGRTLAVAAYTGVELSGAPVLTEGPSLPARCYGRERPEVIDDLSGGSVELIGGLTASSAICIPIRSGHTLGALLLWSDEKGYFEEADIAPLTMFGYYVAALLEMDELSTRLEEALVIDPLTGLHNRLQFDHRISVEVKRAQRYSLNVALVVFDIDNLDGYNEACGHMLGNLALSDVASIFNSGAREVDFLARVGGDEFALILPETGRLGAMRLAERLRSEVSSYPFPVPDNNGDVGVTVSAGVASFPNCGENVQDLVARAYTALEEAKKEGFNRVRLWEEEQAGAES